MAAIHKLEMESVEAVADFIAGCLYARKNRNRQVLRSGRRRELYGRRGMVCRVLAGGPLRAGDEIEQSAPQHLLSLVLD
jgi:MOSC domain-containing protein YiiM